MWTSPETSVLDARNLLVYQVDDFHKKQFETKGDIQTLWGILDIYLQRLEPIVGFTPTETDPIAPLTKHSPNYRKARTELFLAISRTPDFDIQKLKTIQIDQNGVLTLNYDQKSFRISLIETWNNSILPRPSTESIQKDTHRGIEELERSMEHESYLGWAVIIDYLPWSIALGMKIHSLTWMGRKWIEFIVKSIRVKNITTGRMETITFPEAYRGTKEAIRGNTDKMLEKVGYRFAPEKWGYFHPIERAIGETREVIRHMTYEEYIRERPENKVTREQFDGMKKAIITHIDVKPPTMTWSIFLESTIKFLGKHVGELVFFPVFMHNFSKYQDLLTATQWISDAVVFTIASKKARNIPAPASIKWAVPMLAWWLAVIGTHTWAEALDGTKKKWQYLFDNGFGSIYTKGKSYTWHLAGNFGVLNIAEYADIVNKSSRWVSEVTWIGDKDSGIDIGIARTELRVPLVNGYLGTVPEMTWFQSNINLGTNPWDWVRGAMGRDIDDWNNQVKSYNVRLKRAIGDILGKYERNESMFATEWQYKKYGSKEWILRSHLLDIFNAGSDGEAFTAEKKSLIEVIVMEAKKWKSKDSSTMINNMVDQKTSMMYIDDFFLSKRREWLIFRKEMIRGMWVQISDNPIHQKYIWSLLDRMIGDESIVAEWKWEYYRAPLTGEKLKRWIPSEENKLYQSLLADKTQVTVNFPGEVLTLERGQAFSKFLDVTLEYKRESEFLSEIKSWNRKWITWTL
jgi:hypothetical protein